MPSPENIRIETARLDFVPIDRSHATAMFEILNDVTLHEFIGGQPPENAEALCRRYETWERRRSPNGTELWFNWVLREREHGDLIGHAQAGVGAHHADVSWVIGSRWQRRGYASEAALRIVEWLVGMGVKEIQASINPDHLASIRVAEHAGLERTNEQSGGELVWRLRVTDDA